VSRWCRSQRLLGPDHSREAPRARLGAFGSGSADGSIGPTGWPVNVVFAVTPRGRSNCSWVGASSPMGSVGETSAPASSDTSSIRPPGGAGSRRS